MGMVDKGIIIGVVCVYLFCVLDVVKILKDINFKILIVLVVVGFLVGRK